MSANPRRSQTEAQHNVDLLPENDDTDEFEAGDCTLTIASGCDG